MQIAFIITFPTNNSWNGKVAASDKLNAKVKTITAKEFKNNPFLAELRESGSQSFRHRWEDGWSCLITASIDAGAIKKSKKSTNFYGYDHFIENILKFGVCVPKS